MFVNCFRCFFYKLFSDIAWIQFHTVGASYMPAGACMDKCDADFFGPTCSEPCSANCKKSRIPSCDKSSGDCFKCGPDASRDASDVNIFTMSRADASRNASDIYIYIYICICIYVYACINMYIYIYIYCFTCIYIYIYIYTTIYYLIPSNTVMSKYMDIEIDE